MGAQRLYGEVVNGGSRHRIMKSSPGVGHVRVMFHARRGAEKLRQPVRRWNGVLPGL